MSLYAAQSTDQTLERQMYRTRLLKLRRRRQTCVGVRVQIRCSGNLKVVGNEMNGGSDTCGLNSFWYGTHVIGVCLSFNGGVVF